MERPARFLLGRVGRLESTAAAVPDDEQHEDAQGGGDQDEESGEEFIIHDLMITNTAKGVTREERRPKKTYPHADM